LRNIQDQIEFNLKILQLCRKVPYPVKDGESLAISHMVKSMHEAGVEIFLLSFNTHKHWTDPQDLEKRLPHYSKIETVQLDNRLNMMHLIWNAFRNRSYHIDRFVSNDFKVALAKVLDDQKFDIIQLESLYLCPYIDLIRKHSKAKIVLRAHNVEWQVWDRIASIESNLLKKYYLRYASGLLRRYESASISRVDVLVSISKDDERQFENMGFHGPVFYYPIGIDTAAIERKEAQPGKSPVIHFIGSLDWIPNQQGILWFVNECWPLIRQYWPDAILRIAGRNMPDHMHRLEGNGIEILGEIDDAQVFVLGAPFALVPLLSGSGMRAKIIEAMALSRIVLSTSIGIEGIPAEDGKHYLKTDRKEDFINAIKLCLLEPDKALRISRCSFEFVKDQFEAAQLTDNLLNFYKKWIE